MSLFYSNQLGLSATMLGFFLCFYNSRDFYSSLTCKNDEGFTLLRWINSRQ